MSAKKKAAKKKFTTKHKSPSKRKPNTRHGAIGRRIEKAMFEAVYGNPEEGLLHACIAVDATAGRIYPDKNNTDRNKTFLRDNIQLIFFVATALQIRARENISLAMNHPDLKTATDQAAPLEDIIYHVIRCSLIHEGALPENVKLAPRDKPGWTIALPHDGKPNILPWQIVLGLVLAVVGAPVNALERTTNEYTIDRIKLNDFWGEKDRILKILTRPNTAK